MIIKGMSIKKLRGDNYWLIKGIGTNGFYIIEIFSAQAAPTNGLETVKQTVCCLSFIINNDNWAF